MNLVALLLASLLAGLVECSLIFGYIRYQTRLAITELTDRQFVVRYQNNTAGLILSGDSLYRSGNNMAAVKIVRTNGVINPENEKVSLQCGDRVVLGVGGEDAEPSDVQNAVAKVAGYMVNHRYTKVDAMMVGSVEVVAIPVIHE